MWFGSQLNIFQFSISISVKRLWRWITWYHQNRNETFILILLILKQETRSDIKAVNCGMQACYLSMWIIFSKLLFRVLLKERLVQFFGISRTSLMRFVVYSARYRCLQNLYESPVFKRCCVFKKELRSEIIATIKVKLHRRVVLRKIFGGPGPSSFGRQQRLSEITIEPVTSTSSRTTVSSCPVLIWGPGQDLGGLVRAWLNLENSKKEWRLYKSWSVRARVCVCVCVYVR